MTYHSPDNCRNIVIKITAGQHLMFSVERIFTLIARLHTLDVCCQLLNSIPVPVSDDISASMAESLPVSVSICSPHTRCAEFPQDVNQRPSQPNNTLPLSSQTPNSKPNDQILNPHCTCLRGPFRRQSLRSQSPAARSRYSRQWGSVSWP